MVSQNGGMFGLNEYNSHFVKASIETKMTIMATWKATASVSYGRMGYFAKQASLASESITACLA